MQLKNLLIYATSAYLIWRGSRCGFSGAIGNFLALILAATAAWFSYDSLCRYATTLGWLGTNSHLLGYLFTITLALLLWITVGTLLKNLLRFTLNDTLDKLLGALIGLTEALLLIYLLTHL